MTSTQLTRHRSTGLPSMPFSCCPHILTIQPLPVILDTSLFLSSEYFCLVAGRHCIGSSSHRRQMTANQPGVRDVGLWSIRLSTIPPTEATTAKSEGRGLETTLILPERHSTIFRTSNGGSVRRVVAKSPVFIITHRPTPR